MSKSSYYEFLNQAQAPQENEIEEKVKKAFWFHKRRYGSRRLVKELGYKKLIVGRHKVRAIMHKLQLKAIQPKSFVPKTTQSHPHLKRCDNLLINREVSHINEVWVGDITYIPLQDGSFIYLAVWMDLFSRNIVGWELRENMQKEIIILAFNKALKKRKPPENLVVHSDGGGQYDANEFKKIIGNRNFRQSMTRKDNHYDNAFVESLFSRFKAELLENGAFENFDEARIESFEYIEAYYNKIRLHSSLGYKSPLQFEKEWIERRDKN